MCSNYLSLVNHISGSKSAYGGGLCVYYANTPIRGEFYEDVGLFETDAAFNPIYQDVEYSTSKATYSILNTAETNFYKVGAPVEIVYDLLGIRSNFTFPVSSCSEYEGPKMLIDSAITCPRYISTPSGECTTGNYLDTGFYRRGFKFISV